MKMTLATGMFSLFFLFSSGAGSAKEYIDVSTLVGPGKAHQATVEDTTLKLLFPDPSYHVDEERSSRSEDGKEWKLYLSRNCNPVIQVLKQQELFIPQGVERIVYGAVEQCPK